jgi:MFS family permease
MPGRIMVDVTPLRESRGFRLLFIGQLISMMGTQLTVVAIPFQVYRMTHSSLQVGAISLAQFVPLIAGSLIGGPLGDQLDRRRLMLWSTAASVVTSALLAGNASLTHPSLLALYLVSAGAAGLAGFANTARNASVPALVERRHLTAAFSFMQVIMQVGTVVGPALSGFLLGIGLRLVYGLDAATFVVALISVILMPAIPPVESNDLSAWESAKEGMRYLRSRQALQGVYIVDINAMVFGMPRALFPAMAGSVFGGGTITLGFLYAAPGVGALIGAVTTGWVEHIRRQGRMVIFAVVAWGAAITVFGLAHLLWLALVMLALAGWADVISAVLRSTILQTSIPDRFRSRMSSIQMAVVQGGPRLGDMESGSVATLTSTGFSVVSGGLACMAGAAVIALLMPQFRNHVYVGGEHGPDDPHGTPGPSGPTDPIDPINDGPV